MIEVGQVLTLEDDNQYTVIDTFTRNETIYACLVDINNIANFMYVKIQDVTVEELFDLEEIKMVVDIVNKNIHS